MCSLQFCTCWPSFWKVVPRLIVASRRANYSAIRWMEESINPFKMSSTTILVKHIYHVPQPSYAVDVHIFESSSHFCSSYWPRFLKLCIAVTLNSGHLLRGKPQHSAVELRLSTHSTWLPQVMSKCIHGISWCGCACVWNLIALLQISLAELLEATPKSGYLPEGANQSAVQWWKLST